MGAATCCKLETTEPDLAANDANYTLSGVHAATSSATNAARSRVLAELTTKKIGSADVLDAACFTGITHAALSEVSLCINQDAAKPTVTVARVEGNAMTDGELDSITGTTIISAGIQCREQVFVCITEKMCSGRSELLGLWARRLSKL